MIVGNDTTLSSSCGTKLNTFQTGNLCFQRMITECFILFKSLLRIWFKNIPVFVIPGDPMRMNCLREVTGLNINKGDIQT